MLLCKNWLDYFDFVVVLIQRSRWLSEKNVRVEKYVAFKKIYQDVIN